MIPELKEKYPHVPVKDSSLNIYVKSVVKKLCKGRKQQCMDLSFKNKNVGHLISRKLRNRKDNHLRSIDLIEINEGLDREIEDFLIWEDPKNQCSRKDVITHFEPYDFVTNLPLCLKGRRIFKYWARSGTNCR